MNVSTHTFKVVVEVHIGCTEVAAKEGGMSGEYGCHVNLEHPEQDKPHPRQPLVEVGYNQWSGAWDTLPELRRGGEGRGREGRRGEGRGGEGRGGEERGGEGRGGEERGGEGRRGERRRGLTNRLGVAFMNHTMG